MKRHFKKFVSLLSVLLVLCMFPMQVMAAVPFSDVPESQWYYEAVDYAYTNSLFSGTSATTFSPNRPMTRAMFVTVLGRRANVDTSKYTDCRFTDIGSNSAYAAPYAEWAATYGIVTGESATRFNPNGNITREQMAAILYRFAGKTSNDTTFSEEAFLTFPDRASISSYAVDAFKWATSKDIINGSGGKLNPKGTATRAQVAKIFFSSQSVLTNLTITSEVVAPNPNVIDINSIPSGDRPLFEGATTSDRSTGGVIYAREAPMPTKTTYRTSSGQSGSKYAAPSAFTLIQTSISGSEAAYAKTRIGKNGLTQQLINAYGTYQFAEFIKQLDSRISAQWGGFHGSTSSANLVTDMNGSSVQCRIRRENQANYTRTRIAECYIAFGKDPAYRTTALGIASQAEMAAETLESANASYYYCYISNGSLCIVYR